MKTTRSMHTPYAKANVEWLQCILRLSEEGQWEESVGLQIAGEEENEVGYRVVMSADTSNLDSGCQLALEAFVTNLPSMHDNAVRSCQNL